MWTTRAILLLEVIIFLVTTATNAEVVAVTLFDAIQQDNPEAIRTAVANGADINAKGPDGQTPLVKSVWTGKVEAAKTLLDLQADFTIRDDNHGYTVFDVAAVQGENRIVELLGNYQDEKGDTVIKDQLLLSQHEDGYYPIHRACVGKKSQHSKTVVEFLDLDVPYDLKTRDGKTCREMTDNQITKYALLHAAADADARAGDEL